MQRQPEAEQIHRLSVKTLDQVFIARAQEWLGCSSSEAQAPIEQRLRLPILLARS